MPSGKSYVGKAKRRRRIRILILCGLLIAVLLAAVLLGKLLKDRLDRTSPLLSLTAQKVTLDEYPTAEEVFRPASHDGDAGGSFGLIEPDLYADDAQRREACALIAALYDGVSLAPDAEAESAAALIRCAHEHPLTVSAVLPGDVDPSKLAALAEAGADEIILTHVCGTSLTAQALSILCELTDDLHALYPALRVGFALSPEVFGDGMSAVYLETLSERADLLLLDAREAEDPGALCAALAGSIRYYPLRVLIAGEEAAVSALRYALQEAGIRSVQIAAR
jgi:hypothetical protein